MKKHFVTFCSPGTLVSETTTSEIESWDIELAKKMSKGIKERHGAVPYGFYFSTRGRNEDELNSKVIAQSGMYYLGGNILTLDEIKTRNDPKDKILISNMRINGYDKVIENTNSWLFVAPLNEEDAVLFD